MLIIASEKDAAARNTRDLLLDLWDHDTIGSYQGLPIHGNGRIILASIPVSALELDHPDQAILSKANYHDPDLSAEKSQPDLVVYLSRHQSVSGMKTLTVHPIGNYGTAEYGGRDRTLVPSAPLAMSTALRILSTKEVPGFECTFEATHHGPYLEIPTFFIEIGSTVEEWNNPTAIRAIAETMAELIELYENGMIGKGAIRKESMINGTMEKETIENETTRKETIKNGAVKKETLNGILDSTEGTCIGLGGGHYVPRHTKYATREGLDFGHMMPSYAKGNLDQEMALQMIVKTPGVERVCIHGKKFRKGSRVFRELEEGIEIIEY